MGRAFVCCGEPISVYDWAFTFYSLNEKCRRLSLTEGGEEFERRRSFVSFSECFQIQKTRLAGAAFRFLHGYFRSISVNVIVFFFYNCDAETLSGVQTSEQLAANTELRLPKLQPL